MGTPFPGPPFLQPGVPRPQRAFSSAGTHIPGRKHIVLSMGMQILQRASQSEF